MLMFQKHGILMIAWAGVWHQQETRKRQLASSHKSQDQACNINEEIYPASPFYPALLVLEYYLPFNNY